MARVRAVLIVLSVALFSAGVSLADDSSVEVSVEEALADFDFLVQTMAQIHPSLVDGYTEPQLAEIAASRDKLRNSGSDRAFIPAIGRVIAMLHDNHSQIELPQAWRGSVLPVIPLECGLFTLAPIPGTSGSNGLLAGDRIISIQGIDMRDLVGVISETLVGAESRRDAFFSYSQILFSDEVLRLANPEHDPTRTEVVVQRGVEQQVCEIDLSQLRGRFGASAMPLVSPTPGYHQRFPWGRGTLSRPHVRFLANDSIAYLRVDQLRNGPLMDRTLYGVVASAVARDSKALVIDLRFCVGGDSRVLFTVLRVLGVEQYLGMSRFYRYSDAAAAQYGYGDGSEEFVSAIDPQIDLSHLPPAADFNADVYVLTSAHTRSAASWIAAALSSMVGAIVIGEPTGDSPPGPFGNAVDFALPHSGIRVSISSAAFGSAASQGTMKTAPLQPDVYVETTIEDLLAEEDPQMKRVVDMISRP